MRKAHFSPGRVIIQKWMTPALLTKSKSLRAHFASVCKLPREGERYQSYIAERNKFNRDKREAKNIYYANLVNNYKNDAKKLWDIINAQTGKGGKDSGSEALNVAGELISDPKIIANEFSNYFSNIGPQMKSKIPTSKKDYTQFLNMADSSLASMYLRPTTSPEVEKTILTLKNSKASGHDGITTKLLKAISSSISIPLASVINKSFVTGIFPSTLKTAIVTPVFKKDDKQILSNYRPISLLPILSKVFEKIFLSRLLAFFTLTKFFTSHQYGFRKNHTTIDAVSKLVADTLMGFDKNNFTLAVLLDVSKAFDTLDHHILLHKLGRAGIRGAALSWLESYLSARTQMVSFRGTLSGQKQLCCGVPQGSILGPVLYLVYANDISNGVQYSSIIQYADDTTLYLSGSSFEDVISNVNHDLYDLTDWMKANKLAISASKTQVIVFSKNSLHRTPNLPKLKIGEDILGYQDTARLLGIILDSGLTWKAHIDNVYFKDF